MGTIGGLGTIGGMVGVEPSLDQMSIEGGESGSAGSMRSFEHLPRNTTGSESINGSKVRVLFFGGIDCQSIVSANRAK